MKLIEQSLHHINTYTVISMVLLKQDLQPFVKINTSTFPGLVRGAHHVDLPPAAVGHSSHSSSSSPHNPSSSSTSTSPTGAAVAPPPGPHGHYYGAAAHHRQPHQPHAAPGMPPPPPGAAAAAVLSQFYDQHARPQHFPRSGESKYLCYPRILDIRWQ